jgi:acyl-CoA thioesterase I
LKMGAVVLFQGDSITDADLRVRWQADCLDLQPTWISILVGVNDTWRRYESNDPTSTEEYENAYQAILEQTRAKLKAI